ncbi:MAG: aminotransferase class V-fold PLP-dependent enzyme, partial [Alphaproteobacteria bacterium]|nr:aminotransferase class V-fold PLP-dependent enzyme [Alphaproteobacteria bacterium]MDX5415642.1 aminotransferase class V-fold PLP-dependent enzyme [Alphaproteobacteria bacterium]MDX5492902.1 aminotransferase class V-fold PLP-dependent enzyme [Alphaproteobacteria bacterium]
MNKPLLTKEPYDVQKIRADFPILSREVYGKPLVYLDNAASAQKPKQVIDAIADAYGHEYSNVHRGVHFLSQRATDRYEDARGEVRRFLNAERDEEIVFTRGTTEAINLVAQTYGRTRLGPGDEVVVTAMEHHANIVHWQMICQEKGATLRVIPIDGHG